MIIAIDGPSGTGKSTVARAVAKRLGFLFFDTGAMYRSFAWHVLQKGIDPEDEKALKDLVSHFKFAIETDAAGARHYLVDGIDVGDKIRTQEISTLSSKVSAIPFVRSALVKIQRHFGSSVDAVFEGRDMGTVVFPRAEVKVFLTARPEVRAERRYCELLEKFPDLSDELSREQILLEIEQRDHRDTTRTISPLCAASDAILIDTSELSVEQVINRIVELQKKSLRNAKFSKMRLSYRFVYLCARTFFRLFYGLKVYGLSHFRPGSAVIAGNHASFFDPPVISISCPEEVHFLARESLFSVPVLGRLIRVLNSHPVSRSASDAHTFRQLIELLKAGKKVILFPEGQRSADGSLQPLEKGLSFLIYRARCGILPVYVSGTFEAWKPRQKLPKLSGQICCVFGSPIEWEEFEEFDKREAMEEITRRAQEAIKGLKEWLENGAVGDPP